METLNTLKQMLAGNHIIVHPSQPGYSWETEFLSSHEPKQVNLFFSSLEEYLNSKNQSNYYLGHFVFYKNEDKKYFIIDGHQKLTTSIIFLSALFIKLKQIRLLNVLEIETYEDTIKRNEKYRFSTIERDNQIFKDFIIDHIINKDDLKYKSDAVKRIVNAYDFFIQKLTNKDEQYILNLLDILTTSVCTTYALSDKNDISVYMKTQYLNN